VLSFEIGFLRGLAMNPNRRSVADAAIDEVAEYVQGIRPNIGQFAQQLLQVFFVGLTIGMQRNVVPALAETEFGVPAGSFTLLMAFVVSFPGAYRRKRDVARCSSGDGSSPCQFPSFSFTHPRGTGLSPPTSCWELTRVLPGR
jgi:hypothetical protein